MKSLKTYRELTVWQKSIDLTVKVYKLTRFFPAEEKFGIISQMRRAASSIPANIAEGQARNTKGEFLQFLGIARGSVAELETFVTLSEKLEFLNQKDSEILFHDLEEINKMLHGLTKSLSTHH
ncbi:MAG: four helix bundle protein [Fibrobacter sp.]|nr:four helix bundle protein [Fibrobacter sp.]